MSRLSRSLVVLAAVVPVVVGMTSAAPVSARSGVASPDVSPVPAIAGERVRLDGAVPVPAGTPVILQTRTRGLWQQAAASHARAGGHYGFVVRAPRATASYRVVSGPVTTPAAPLVVVPQGATLTAPERVLPDADATATGRFTPARPGRNVDLQERASGAWRTVATRPQGGRGTVSFPVPTDELGAVRYRAVARAADGAAQVTSPARSVTVEPPRPRIARPVADTTVAGTVAVRVDVDHPGRVRSVAVFAGGVKVADATRRGDGNWSASVDTTTLANGSTDLTARVVTTDASTLVPSVPVTVQNAGTSTSSGLPDGFRLDTITGGLNLPTSFVPIDEHRTLVTEKDGLVRLVVGGALRIKPVLDLTGQVENYWDQGLIGIALDPGFADNGWFYVTYALRRDAADLAADASGTMGAQRVSRYTLTGETADPASGRTVLGRLRGPACFDHPATDDCLPLQGTSHTIDDLLFLSDGSLLVSVGDGQFNSNDAATKTRSQDLDILAGKVLRIDPATGRGLPDNPYYDPEHPGSNRGRVWAYGFRNPFRMSLGPDGHVYVADVGQAKIEEIDEIEPGGNYGWPCLEGDQAYGADIPSCAGVIDGSQATVAPVFTYPHFYVGSITGGVFYTGDTYPEDYQGRYLFADYAYSVLWEVDLDDTSTFEQFAGRPGAGGAVKFAMGPDGNVWYLSITTGELRRIVYDPDDTGCPDDRFVAEYYPNPDLSGEPNLVTCEGSVPTGPGFTPPPYVANDDGEFSVRWTGHPRMASGTYAVQAEAAGDLTVSVDGTRVGDTVRIEGAAGSDATPQVEVELSSTQAADDAFRYALTRTGSSPVVTLAGLAQGEVLAPGTTGSWRVSATDSAGHPLSAHAVSVTVSLLHYGSAVPHVHPSGTFVGTTGGFMFDDEHAPGATVFRVVAQAVDDQGTTGQSAPVYVCLTDSEVGPCVTR